jgi:hypothetical protein
VHSNFVVDTCAFFFLLCFFGRSGRSSFIVMTFLVRECYGSPKISIKFVKIRQNSLKFTPEECYDKVLNEEFKKKLFCKMKNVITRSSLFFTIHFEIGFHMIHSLIYFYFFH